MTRYWIIGASSGIGRAVAEKLAAEGHTLALSARSRSDLEALCATLGQSCHSFPLDVTDVEATKMVALQVASALGEIDSVLFMAGVYTPMALDVLDIPKARQMVEVNLCGALHLLHAIVPRFKQRGQGQIVLCASVAGYGGLPGGQPYCATKAALINLAESLYIEAVPYGIDVKVINPGFVKTRLTDQNDFTMPMMITAEKAADAIVKGIKSSAFEIHFPKGFTCALKALSTLPIRLRAPLMRRRKG